jgi:hypothetical protein
MQVGLFQTACVGCGEWGGYNWFDIAGALHKEMLYKRGVPGRIFWSARAKRYIFVCGVDSDQHFDILVERYYIISWKPLQSNETVLIKLHCFLLLSWLYFAFINGQKMMIKSNVLVLLLW